MKWLMYLILVALLGASSLFFFKKGKEMAALNSEITAMQEKGDPEGKVGELQNKLNGMDSDRTFSGILITFLGAGVVGIFFVVYLLPFFAQRVTHAVYDSAEMVDKDVMRGARSLLAQGDYHGAIAAFQEAAQLDPLNRLPWVEIAKIYKDNLEDPAAAIGTIRYALESQEWEVNDAAYFLFRLAELYDEVEGDRDSAIAIMNQVVEQFPSTRHSANATHKLHEWANAAAAAEEEGYQAVAESQETALTEEEEEYFARMREKEAQEQNPGA